MNIGYTYLILARNTQFSAALAAWLLHVRNVNSDSIFIYEAPISQTDVILVCDYFADASNWIDIQLKKSENNSDIVRMIAITDIADGTFPTSLNPTLPYGDGALIGMLVLAYPEIDWLLIDIGVQDDADRNEKVDIVCRGWGPEQLKLRLDQRIDDLTPLFDGMGLRDRIRSTIPSNGQPLVSRTDRLIAFDEERSFAWFHAYIGYRSGYLSDAVVSIRGMRQIESRGKKPKVVFEDLSVDFPDDFERHMQIRNKKTDRYLLFPWIKAEKKVTVTSNPGDGQEIDEPPIHKPIGGIFRASEQAGLIRSSRENSSNGTANTEGHAVAGQILLVVESLIMRSRRIFAEKVNSVPAACRGAVLAVDALELLGSKAPTLALDALSLKHRFEVVAECKFIGVQQHIAMKPRLKEIESQVKEICGRYGDHSKREIAAWNAELFINWELVDIFRQSGKFDEEMEVMSNIRKISAKIRVKNASGSAKDNALRIPIYLFYKYFNSFLDMSWTFFISFILIFFFLCFIFILGAHYNPNNIYMTNHCAVYHLTYDEQWVPALRSAISEVFITVVSSQPSANSCVWAPEDGFSIGLFIVVTGIIFGLVNLGIFISFLYLKVLRK